MRRVLLAAGVSLLAVGAAQAQVTEEDLLNDQASTADVLTNGMGRDLQRYSPLDILNKENVQNLMPAWAFSFGGEKQRGQETQPLVYDGIMYVTGSYSRLYAIDIKTGEEIWQYDARLPEGILPCCDVINRGAAIYGDKIYFGTLDATHRGARPQDRRRGLARPDRRLQGGILHHRGAADREGAGDHRQLRRRVRRRRRGAGARRRDRRRRLDPAGDRGAHGHLQGRALDHDRDRERDLARRHVEDRRRRDLARRLLRRRDRHPDLRRGPTGARGTATCAAPARRSRATRATTSTPRRGSASIPRTARSSGTSRPPRARAGTSTA